MTWTRLTDTWCDDPVFEPLDMSTRWHYLAMIQHCSRTNRYDGVLRLVDARRCSDVEDPTAAVGALVVVGLVENVDGATVRLVRIDQHLPPPSVRDAAAATKIRVSRHRRHKNGDHSECLSNASCNALPQDGTGQDGPGQEEPPSPESEDDDRSDEYLQVWGEAS